jgi:hypothetical protein
MLNFVIARSNKRRLEQKKISRLEASGVVLGETPGRTSLYLGAAVVPRMTRLKSSL